MATSDLHASSEPALKTRILLVEDEATNMVILSAYLRMSGFDVTEAVNGKLAWEILARDQGFDLLVTDRRMPEMDGLELAIRVRNDSRLKNLPVIMQTSATEPEEILEGIRAGVYYYLAKPYEEEVLLGIVRSAAQESKLKAQLKDSVLRQHDAMNSFVSGEIHLKTIDDVQNVALLLGSMCARSDLAASGFYELLLNAVEHGNLGIGYEAKNKLLSAGQWEHEIQRRLDMPENWKKRVVANFKRNGGNLEVVIRDDGAGFDWTPFMEIEPSRATQSSGRGIAKAALLSFDRVEFSGNGNTVKIITPAWKSDSSFLTAS